MSDCELTRLDVMIPKRTYDAVVLITGRQNTVLSNNVSRLLSAGIAATYERWPNLKGNRSAILREGEEN